MSQTKPLCFDDEQWKIYKEELSLISQKGKSFDFCFDCTIQYQSKMRKEGRCAFPMKRLDKIVEYA
jgi:hypothetical protein